MLSRLLLLPMLRTDAKLPTLSTDTALAMLSTLDALSTDHKLRWLKRLRRPLDARCQATAAMSADAARPTIV